jgi:uncharacterized membrane protein
MLYLHDALMKLQKLTLYRILALIIIATTFLYAMLVGNSMLIVFSIITGFILTITLARKQQKIIVDERTQLINEKSSTMTMQTFVAGASLLGFILWGLDYIGYAELYPLSFILLYSACALMILNMIFRGYYRRKYGG